MLIPEMEKSRYKEAKHLAQILTERRGLSRALDSELYSQRCSVWPGIFISTYLFQGQWVGILLLPGHGCVLNEVTPHKLHFKAQYKPTSSRKPSQVTTVLCQPTALLMFLI